MSRLGEAMLGDAAIERLLPLVIAAFDLPPVHPLMEADPAEVLLRAMLGESLTKIGERAGVSRERARQIVAREEERVGRPLRDTFYTRPRKPWKYRPSREYKFWERIEVDHETDCWNWTGRRFPTGYGGFTAFGEMYAHRVSYRLFKGPLVEGLVMDHLCRNTGCVNPDHLELVTAQENSHRSPHWDHERGMWKHSPFGRRPLQTHCRRGHELSGDNLKIYSSRGREQRRCLTCFRQVSRDRYARRKVA